MIEFELCNSVIKVDLGLSENQELNLLECYNILKKTGIEPNFELFTQTRPLRFRFDGYYFNLFHTGKITVFTKKNFNRKNFQAVLDDLQVLIFKENIVSTTVSE